MSEVKRFLAQKTPIGTMMKEHPEGYWITSEDFDAQRLRADTAEAELRIEKLRADAAVGDANEAERKLAAAEQRIADLKSVLERMLEDDDMPVHWFAQRIDAALNQKSEGESQ